MNEEKVKVYYNTELKNRYIAFKNENTCIDKTYLPNLFNRTEIFERNLQKDVCNFSFKEIVNMYKTWNFVSFASLRVQSSNLKLYTDWCIQQGLVNDSQNHFDEMNVKIYMSCINKIVKDKQIVIRDDILSWKKLLKNNSDKFMLLALFEGIYGFNYSDFYELHISNFDFQNATVTLKDRKISVSKELLEYAYKAAEEKEWESISGTKTWKYLDGQDGKIIKDLNNVKEYSRRGFRMARRLKLILEQIGVEAYISRNAIIKSGYIQFIKDRSKKLGITPEKYTTDKKYKLEIENQYGINIPRPTVFYKELEEYLK